MKTTKRIAAFLMVLCLALPLLCACNNDQSGQTTPTGTVEIPEGEDPNGILEVPVVDYDGYEFTFFTGSNVSTCPFIFTADEEDNAIDEAIHRRNATIEDLYNIEIEEIRQIKDSTAGAGAAYMAISASYESGDALYDAAVASGYDCGTLACSGMLANLRDYHYINLNKNWWDQAGNKQLTVGDRTYFTAGDISYIDDNFTYAIVFNKNMALEHQLEDMYKLVEDGKWTYDKLYEYSKKVTSLDNVEGFSEGDVYGFLGYVDTIWMSFSSIGATVAAINNDGELELTLSSERNFKIITDWTEFGQSEAFVNWQLDAAAKSTGWAKIYSSNQALFFGATIDGIYKLRNTDVDYGFLPWPKFDETQELYTSGMAPNHISLFCIPETGDDEHRERASILVEAIGYYSSDVIDGFYEKNLHGKSVRDDESNVTLDIIFANKIFDLGYYYNIGKYRAEMFNRFRAGNKSFSQFYEEQYDNAMAKIKQVNDLYKGLLDL